MAKIIERKLGRENAFGLADIEKKIIEIDPRQKPKTYFDTLIHEALHLAFPEANETRIRKATKIIRDILWTHKYRKVNQ
jgi:hypothetical protein